MSCYVAGLPSYPRNFSRDTLIAGIIANSQTLTLSQLLFSSRHQGRKLQKFHGEEKGKIHHEYPGVAFRAPYFTTYDACDTTALYLVGIGLLWHQDRPLAIQFINAHQTNIDNALHYLESHITDDIFWEYPPRGAEQFSLRCTYWKDSIIPADSIKKEPDYPISYALVQFQVARALLACSEFMKCAELAKKANAMFKAGIMHYLSAENFCFLQTKKQRFEQISSDELHCLAYIPAMYAPLIPLTAIRSRVRSLITSVGVACTPLEIASHLSDTYHGYVVWIFEQAMIDYGCLKFGLTDLNEVTKRCAEHIRDGQELLSIVPSVQPSGNSQQLWSVATKIYFSSESSLRTTTWL